MSRTAALVVCPGRGSYGRDSLGSLRDLTAEAADVVADCDAHRRDRGRPTLTEIDGEDRFRTARHLAGEHASLLTFACSLVDLARLGDTFDVVGVVGNSMGWYTALAATGALPRAAAIELVETMGWYQHRNVIGGQLLLPVGSRRQALDDLLAEARDRGHGAWWSIHLGDHGVIGADDAGLAYLLERLPPMQVGERTYPLRLPLHSAFHTPLMAPTAARAADELAELPMQAPRLPLIDGRGTVYRPLWADPRSLLAYTLGAQVEQPFDFTTALRTALRHCGPDLVVVLGPGNSLGGPVMRLLIDEGWAGVRDREAFAARQQSSAPVLLSFGVAEQRARLL